MKHLFYFCLFIGVASPAYAGPPYETDDPATTDNGHWEIYAFATRAGLGPSYEGAAGFDLNYGLAENVQLTATVPVAYDHDRDTRVGAGDLELGLKYRFYHDEANGLAIAVFPRVILPTAGRRFGTGKTGVLLPIWAQQDWGSWSLFGGGGYRINPGSGNRDFWVASVALTHAFSDKFSMGAEATREGSDAVGARSATQLGVGAIATLGGPLSLLLAGGPRFEDGGGPARYHVYAALGIAF